jgi:hypothetical protein
MGGDVAMYVLSVIAPPTPASARIAGDQIKARGLLRAPHRHQAKDRK